MLVRSTMNLAKSLVQAPIRSYHGGVPGNNLPFQIKNRYRFTALCCVFFGSGLGLPFLIVRHQLLKNRGD